MLVSVAAGGLTDSRVFSSGESTGAARRRLEFCSPALYGHANLRFLSVTAPRITPRPGLPRAFPPPLVKLPFLEKPRGLAAAVIARGAKGWERFREISGNFPETLPLVNFNFFFKT